MSNEPINSGPGQDQQAQIPPSQAPGSIPIEPTAAERMVSGAANATSQAADALRRGELMQQSQVDPLADSDDRLIAMLSYITQIFIPVIMPLIVLISESSKKRPFQRYHAIQSMVFAVVFWAMLLLIGIGATIMQIIPIVGQIVGLMVVCMMPILWFVSVLLLLYYGLQAYKGKRFSIPGLSAFLHDQGWI